MSLEQVAQKLRNIEAAMLETVDYCLKHVIYHFFNISFCSSMQICSYINYNIYDTMEDSVQENVFSEFLRDFQKDTFLVLKLNSYLVLYLFYFQFYSM